MIIPKALNPKGNRFFEVTTEPSVEPITVEKLKIWARIDGTDEDSLLEDIIKSARRLAEKWIHRSFLTQTITMVMDQWLVDEIEFPFSPLISVTSVETLSEAGVATVYSSDNYYVITESVPGRLAIKQDVSKPENQDRDSAGFKIVYVAGYGPAATNVPQTLRDAIKMWATDIYENRVMGGDPPKLVRDMLAPFIIHNDGGNPQKTVGVGFLRNSI